MDTSSYLSPSVEPGPSSIHGNGVFAVKPIPRGQLAVIFGGKIITRAEEYALPRRLYEDLVQMDRDLFLCMIDPAPYGVNHSCNPNLGIRGHSLLVARRNIEVGEELTFDYGTCELPDVDWKIECCCGAPNCRGIIDGHDWERPEFQQANQGYMSWYLEDMITQQKEAHYGRAEK